MLLLEALGENRFPCLFKLLEAAHTPCLCWLVTLGRPCCHVTLMLSFLLCLIWTFRL